MKNKKKLNRMVKQVQLYTLRTATRIKFGIKIPRDHAEAMAFDKANGNSLWADAEKLELDQLYEYKTFRTRGRNGSMRKGYTRIRVRMIYDAKQCGKRKARLVAGGHLTGPNEDTYYSSVVSLKAMRIVLFLAELNGMDTCAGDIGNAYLEAHIQEKMCFIAGPELAAYGHAGHVMEIVKALYGLKSSGSWFHEKFADSMMDLGFSQAKQTAMYECMTRVLIMNMCVSMLMILSTQARQHQSSTTKLKDIGYKLKGVEAPTYHLGGDFKRVTEPEEMLTWGAQTYVKRMMVNYEKMFSEPVPKCEIHAALDPSNHPELDSTDFCDAEEIKLYWSMIGELQWAVALGRIDIMCAVVTMGSYRPQPRKGHLE